MNFENPNHSASAYPPENMQMDYRQPQLQQYQPYRGPALVESSPLKSFDLMFSTSNKMEEKLKPVEAEMDRRSSGSSDQDPNKDKFPTKDHSMNNEESYDRQKAKETREKKKKLDIFELEDPNKSKFPKINAFLENTWINVFLLLITLWALFADDFRLLIFPKVMDIMFDVVTIIVIIFFLVDIVLNAIAVRGYLVSMFFILDLISTFTMILDITVLNEKLFYNNG